MQVETVKRAIEAPRGSMSVNQQALEAQSALLPYAVGVFIISLPAFVWAGSYADNAIWMAGAFVIFAATWGLFYMVVNWLKNPEVRENVALRGNVHLLSGLLWSGAVAYIAFFANQAGAARETLLMMALAASTLIFFFTAPWLPSLLIVGPAAAAAPLFLFHAHPSSRDAFNLAWGAVALAMALALIMNRMLRAQFALAAEREILIAERAGKVEEARQLAQSKSDLVATLSHEIRNGLTGVTHVLAAAAGRNGRSAPSREQLSAALDAANDLISVLNTTLDSETAEAGRLSVEPRPFDAVALIRDLVLLNRPNAAAKGLQLSLHIDPELADQPGAAIADVHRVRQILANLISNGLKFTVRGQVEVRVGRAPQGRLSVEVADTGPGLSTDELERAFVPFNRIERTSAGTSGAGLGLSLSRQLARLMGGELSAHSAVGVGSCFRLDLPFDPAAAAEHEVEEVELGPAPTGGDHRRLRVLIAEDDALNAAMLRAVVEQLGHQVVHALDGRRAVELSKVCEFDLLMIDGRMPNMDGAEAIAAIRALDAPLNQIPIVAVIGGDAEEARECQDAGADAVLRKPVSVSAVARAVADAVAQDRAPLQARVA